MLRAMLRRSSPARRGRSGGHADRMRRVAMTTMVAGLAVLAAGWLTRGAAGRDRRPARAATAEVAQRVELPPLPTSRARLVQPVAGESTATPDSTPAPPDPGLKDTGPAPTGPASAGFRGAHPAHGGE